MAIAVPFCIKRSPTRIINKLHSIYGIVIKPALQLLDAYRLEHKY